MQPLVNQTRADFTEDEITALIKTDPSINVGAGLELLNRNLEVLADISNNLLSGEIKRSNYATLHGSCMVSITTQLAWGSAIIRPYMLITNGVITARFNLGAYFTNTPDHSTGEDVTTYNVDGYDILDALNQPVGDSYAVAEGVEYLTAIENILNNQGYTQYIIDRTRAGTTLPSAKGWAMSDNVTWLSIVNDLLSAIGYRGIYSDWDGKLICTPYITVDSRTVEWTYDDGEYTSQLGPQQTVKHDYYATPNRWVGIRTNQQEDTTPSEGDGIYTYQNDADGETSVEARGRVITRRVEVDVADQDALETSVMRAVFSDMSVGTSIDADTTPNPLHWHFDILQIETTELGTLTVQETEWSLPLNGEQMSHNWAVI